MDLLFARIVVTLRLESGITDPYVLFSLKSMFRDAFRRTVCHSGGGCDGCTFRADCPHQAVFAQDLTADPAALKRHQKPPLPFVFQIPLVTTPSKEGQEAELGLVVVGTAMSHVREFCLSLLSLFRDDGWSCFAKASVAQIESEGCSGSRNLLMSKDGELSLAGFATISAEDLTALNILPSDRVTVRVVTPLRLLTEGRPVTEFSFSPFIRSLLRRISSLAYYYCDSVLDLDYKRLARLADSIVVKEHIFSWTEWGKGRLTGLTGSGTVEGELADFHLLLLLGEYLNCGKDATFGMGRYQTVP
jgi:hypothetical protein